MPELKLRTLWHAIGCALVALVIYLTLTSQPPEVALGFGLDAGHVIAYFTLMMWYAQIIWNVRSRLRVALALALMGTALEFLQLTTQTRSFEVGDMLRNIGGIALALLIARTPLDRVLVWFETKVLR